MGGAADKGSDSNPAKLAAVPLRHEAASRDQSGQEFERLFDIKLLLDS